MWHLVIKDIKANKKPLVQMTLFSVLYTLFSLYQAESAWMLIILAFVAVIVSIAMVSVRELVGIKEVLWCSLPSKRKEIVIAKYLSSVLIITGGIILFLFLTLTLDMIIPAETFKFADAFNLRVLGTFSLACTFFLVCLFPPYFRLRNAAGVWLPFFLILFIIIRIFIYIKDLMKENGQNFAEFIASQCTASNCLILIGVTVTLAVFSIYLSIRFYEKAEF